MSCSFPGRRSAPHHTLHSTLHPLHFTPHFTFHIYTLHSTLYTLHSTLYTPHFTLRTPHSTLSTPHSTFYTPHSAVCTLHFPLHTPDSTLYTPHSALYTPHFTLYTLLSTLHAPHSALYTWHSTLYIPYFTLQTLHSTLHTLHATFFHIPQSTVHWYGNSGKMYKTINLFQKSVLRDCISMCFSTCTTNICVSIRVRGLHLVWRANQVPWATRHPTTFVPRHLMVIHFQVGLSDDLWSNQNSCPTSPIPTLGSTWFLDIFWNRLCGARLLVRV